jgi:hypothetical protein
MTTLYILDVDEFRPVAQTAAAADGVRSRRLGHYLELASEAAIVVERRAAGVRRAVWYSAVAGVRDGRITQYDGDALRVEPR